MKRLKGSISIYFVFAILLIISVIMSVTEMARINCQRLYLQIATDAGSDSMASLYNRKLYEYYSLYGVEYRTKEMLEREYLEYIYPYFMDEDRYIRNWYIADINEDNININFSTLVDEENLENEIKNYMKYKLIGKVINYFGKQIFIEDENDLQKLIEESNELFEESEKSSLYAEIHERYFNFAKDIKTLEDYAKNISNYVNRVNASINQMRTIPTSGSSTNAESVLRKINDLNSNILRLKENLSNYKNKISEFRIVVNESYDKYDRDRLEGRYEFNDDICTFVESEFDHFVSFVDEDSDMNKAIDIGFDNCRELSLMVTEHNSSIERMIHELNVVESQIREARRDRDRDADEIRELNEEKRDILDEMSDYFKDVKDSYKDVFMEQIDLAVSTGSHSEDEGILNGLIALKDGALLNLILGSEKVRSIDSNDLLYNSFNILSKCKNISIDKVILTEYELDKFNYYNKELNDEITKSDSKKLEVERLIAGRVSDLDNVKEVINKIFLIRIAMNVLHIYKSSSKRQMARNFSTLLFSGFSPLMVEVIFLLIITAWGTAQAIIDMRRIMKNKRVKFMHNDETFTISVENILNFARQEVFPSEDVNDSGDGGVALNYKDYLRLLLIMANQSEVDNRMASIIEKNIREVQEGFDFEKLIYSFTINNKFLCRHYFTNFTFVDAKDVQLFSEYLIRTEAYRSFYDNNE